MKNKANYILLLLLLWVSFMGYAQESDERKIHISGGPKIEANFTKYITSQHSSLQSHMRAGASVGGFFRMDISRHFATQAELLIHNKNSYIEENNKCHNMEYWGLEIPIYAFYLHDCGKEHHIYVGGGPYTEFGISATAQIDKQKIDMYAKERNDNLPVMIGSNSGFAIMFGYEMPFGLQINMSCKMSISNILDENSSIVEFYPMALSIGLAYRFEK